MKNLDGKLIPVYKETASELTGHARRAFQAKITKICLEGNVRKAESMFGWGRETVSLGMKELASGYICYVEVHERGDKKTEVKSPTLEQDIGELVEPYTQVDPKFQSPFTYTRITARALRKALIDSKGYTEEELPTERTLNDILNRLGYKLRRVQKTKPIKKIKEADAIFDNVHKINREADADPQALRISIDTKAKVKIGDFSRGGKARAKEAPKGADHDMSPTAKLVPCGILEVVAAALTTVVGNSAETSDFIVDALQIWWDDRKAVYSNIKNLVINIDNGPSVSSHRTQFIKRITEFSEINGLNIHLVYYPPYYSKYNPVERCWGILETHWNGTILDSVDTALEWIKTMTWKSNNPIVHFLDKTYEKGIKLTKKGMKKYNDKIKRAVTLPRWDLVIEGASW
jgi:transposase